MARLYNLQCQGSDYEQFIVNRSDYAYRLAEPPDVQLWAQFAWCDTCRRVVQAERLLSPQESEEWMAGRTNRHIHQDARRYRQMLNARRSPPRCLECGGVSILPASSQHTETNWSVPHPTCGREMLIQDGGYARLAPGTDVYSPEGNALERVLDVLLPDRGY